MNQLSIIQLNCRSINCKLGEIKLMIYTRKPCIVAFCETWLDKFIPKFVDYNCEWKNRGGFAGGLGLLIRRGIQYQNFSLDLYPNGYLEVQAIKVQYVNGKGSIIMNVYNPCKPVSVEELQHYIKQLGNDYHIIGDFNAHTKILDTRCARANATGQAIENIVTNVNICLANPLNFYTYVDGTSGKRSCLDLCFSSPSLAHITHMEQLPDVGSDHVPVSIMVDYNPVYIKINYPKKWKVNKEALQQFTHTLSNSRSNLEKPNDINRVAEDFSDRIWKAASETIQRTTGSVHHRKQTCWWNCRCSKAVAERRYAKKQLEKFPSRENIIKYREKSVIARKVCKESKRESFHQFVTELKYDTPCGTVWKKIKSLKSGNSASNIPIEENGKLITDDEEKANVFAKKFQSNTVSGIHKPMPDFKDKLNGACYCGKDERYNSEVTLEELLHAIKICKEKSPGLDCVSNILIKHMHMQNIKELLNIVNQSYMTGQVPECWKLGIVVPVLKPGKISTDVSSYRPITLLSCIGKIMERVIQRRLQYIVDRDTLLDGSQYGFCRGQGTLDIHIKLEKVIRQCLESKEICLVIFVDLSSAFDRVWPEGLITKLIDKGIKGNMISWLYNYFLQRKIKVRVNGTLSEETTIRAGTPQGAVLSPLLFNIMMSDLPSDDDVKKYIYADDITLTCCGKDLKLVKKKLQSYLSKFTDWIKDWGMVVNGGKTYMQYYTRRRIQSPVIRMNNEVIKYKKVHKLLGLFYDSPLLNWKPHIDYLKVDCLKRIDIMKSIASPNWGASSKVLRTFYISYIRAKIDYGAVIYCTAAKSNLEKLDKIQNAAARLILGARKSSPILSLQAEAHIPPLDMHRGYLTVKALIKLSYKSEGKSILDPVTDKMYCETDYPVNSFMKRALLWTKLLDINIKRVYEMDSFNMPPWENDLQVIVFYDEVKFIIIKPF